ncbi:MAG TPA: DUF748 domain-containing protein [Methylomirabilota bacterium]|jgi:hypothetical protein|nr:DUF748 domain-containing protein [Methylomirabilota bacterium]
MSIPERALPQQRAEPDRPATRRSRLSGWRRWRPQWGRPRLGRRGRRVLIGIGILVALLVIASFFVDEPIRRAIEHQMNARLKGYTAHIERLSFHPIGGSLTLYNLVFIQDAHPDPPVLRVPRLDASVQWKALFFGRVVANFRFQEPELYADRTHVEKEAKDPTPLEQHGWQQAFEAIYPLKINEVKIVDGRVTYVDEGPYKPLTLRKVNVVAENIRNVHSRDRIYPSTLKADAAVFDAGTLRIDGNADFLAEPHLGVKAAVELQGIELDYFKPITNRQNVIVQRGTLAAKGKVEYAPTIKMVDLQEAVVRDIRVDYVHTPTKAGAPKAAAVKTEQTARQATKREDLILRIRDFRVLHADVGVVNKAITPPFRMFLSDAEMRVSNVSNRLSEGIGKIEVRGKFMGSGGTHVVANFRPDQRGPDFDADIKIEHTDMRAMNDLLRAYGKFDVVGGDFSFYSELHVKNGYLNGYVKPLFKDVKAYDPEQDRDKGFTRRLYERVISGVSKLLKNVPRKEVATKVDISGPLESAHGSTWQAVTNLIRNAFFKAILPGFEREVTESRGGKG